MKQAVERIGPFVPAFATVGASVCASFLLLPTGPLTFGPRSVGPPLTRESGRIVASLSPPAQVLPGGRGPLAPPRDRRRLASPAHGSATSAPASQHSRKQVSRVGAPAAPPHPTPSTPPAPPVTPPAPPVTIRTASEPVKPGWGHGDRNHVHTGPPGRRASGRKKQPTPAPAGPPVATLAQPSAVQNGEKKSTGSPGKGSSGLKNQPKPAPPQPPVAAATPQHGPVQNGEKKSTGR